MVPCNDICVDFCRAERPAAMHDRIETNVFIQQFQYTEFNKDVNNLCLEMFSFWLLTIFVLVLTVAIFIPYLNY